MGKIRLKITYGKVVKGVEFLDADRIDRTRLAQAMGTSVANVSAWIAAGYVPEKYLPRLRTVDMGSVITHRKKYTWKAKKK